MSPRSFLAALACGLTVAVLAAPAVAAPADELVWRGDQATGRAFMDDLAREYAKEKKGHIVLQPFSTVSGLDAVAQGSADIAGSARGKYARRAEEAGINFVPVALDAAVPITHPKNPATNLTLTQIHDIYYGRITNWKELGGNDTPINLYAIAAPLDGVEFSLRELVFRNGDQRVAAPRLYLNTTKLEEAIALDPAGLGLSTLANVHANKKVKALAVEGVSASTATIADGSYPLYITLYLAERDDSPKHEAVGRFIAFLDTPAAKDILRRHALVPYADASNVNEHNAARVAFIDAHMGRAAAGTALAMAAAAPAPTPVSAPRATLEAKTRIAPTAESTQAARENLARAEKKAAAKKALASSTAAAKKSPPAHARKPVALTSAAKATPAVAKPRSKAAVAHARASGPAKKKATAKAAPAKAAAPAKPVSFGNVSGG